MNFDDAITAFVSADYDLPVTAMRWTTENWAEASPRLLTMLIRYADGKELSDDVERALFFAVHLMAQNREAKAFPAMCRLAAEPDAVEAVLGEGVTETLKRILISTYGGDVEPLKRLIEDAQADEFARNAGLEAFAYLVHTGRIDREEAQAYLTGLFDTLLPRDDNHAWVGWSSAIACLGMEVLAPLVRQAFDRGFIGPSIMAFEDFQSDLDKTRADPQGGILFENGNIVPLDDAIAVLSQWYAFSERRKADEKRQRRALRKSQGRNPFLPGLRINPRKEIGRNDPCPCGSGKKYKKCCLQ